MLFAKCRSLALASSLALFSSPATVHAQSGSGEIVTSINNATRAQSVFVSPGGSLAFGINIPSSTGVDLVFTLQVPIGISWGAVGLGSSSMAASLMLVLYASGDGTNVTLSVRTAPTSGPRGPHSEPVVYKGDDIEIEALPGTGITNGSMVYNGVCRSCQNFRGGYIDFTSTQQRAAFATGPTGWILSDDQAAPLRYHYEHGSFTIDMHAAEGNGGVPVVALTDKSEGATMLDGSYVDGKRNWASVFHAIIMVGVFVGLLPLGVLILRVGQWVRWHAANQTLALVGVLVGFSLGIYTSLWYVRSKSFKNAHQILGLIIVALFIVQFFLGFFHHRTYKKTQQPTKLSTPHVWLGRLVMVLGVVNGFLGFPFAQSPNSNYILAGLVIAVFPICCFVLLWRRVFGRRREARHAREREQGVGVGYDAQPWNNAQTYGGGAGGGAHHAAAPPPAYTDQHGMGIGLRDMSGAGKERSRDNRTRGGDVGVEQTPREIV